jgi:hypothetical protein
VWASTIPAAALGRTAPDTADFESDGVHTFFPHRYGNEGRPGRFWDWYTHTPMLDGATLDFARALVTSLGLGRDDAPDFLNVSLSQTDRIGHEFSASSREALDNLLRLDRELGAFLAFLDQTVGPDRWTIALSADHGALLAPEVPEPAASGEPQHARRATRAELDTLTALATSAARTADDPRMPARLAAALKRLPFVADAGTDVDLLKAPRDSFAVLERRSLFPGRAGGELTHLGVEVRYAEGYLIRERGSTHGTPYWYDRHVPMIFMGPGIPAGRDATRVATVDFAPTLARLSGISAPKDLDGRPLAGVVSEAPRPTSPW